MAQTVTDPIQKVVEDPTDKTAWILICIAILINLYQLWQNKMIAKTVEKFKDDLVKSQYKFTRHTELQIECLKKYYDLIVTLHFSYQLFQNKENHDGFKKSIKQIQDDFLKVLFFSNRNKILLTAEILEQYRIVYTKFQTWNELPNWCSFVVISGACPQLAIVYPYLCSGA
nr:hypothetical protein [uncultured Flavobacterium sp.]